MSHCVAGYAYQLNHQPHGKVSMYVYHLELVDGEQATMMIHRRGGRWRIREIKGVGNAEVSQKMLSYARNWLKSFTAARRTF